MYFCKIIVLLFLPFCLFSSQTEAPAFENVDVLVLGSGAGGLTASIYLARSGLNPVVIEGRTPGGAITLSNGVQNWPGELDISGFDLMEKIRLQAKKNGVVLSQEELVSVDFSSMPYSFTLQDLFDPSKKRIVKARSCIIATGTKMRKLGIPGEEEYAFKGVYTCAICDGPLYKGKAVAVVGGGDSAVLEADYLAGLASKVYLIVRKDKLKGLEKNRIKHLETLPNVEIIYQAEVKEVIGKDSKVTGLELLGGRHLVVDALFLAIGSEPNTQLFSSAIELDKNGYIVLKNQFETSLPGVFAVGDVADPVFKQAICAAGDGAKAAIQAQMFLSTLKPIDSPKTKEGVVCEIKSLTELKTILKTSKVPVLVDFYATWCGPCRYLSGFIDKSAKELSGKVLICKVNLDTASEVFSNYQILSMPTVLEINPEGKEVVRKEGAPDIIQYVSSLK